MYKHVKISDKIFSLKRLKNTTGTMKNNQRNFKKTDLNKQFCADGITLFV